MEATIDKYGRILIPQRLRKLFGLRAGAVLEIKESGQEIRLKPLEQDSPLTRKNGVLVCSAEPVGDIVEMIAKVRSERSKKVINPGRE
ncbi:MAG: AbrB family transcriptional regulator [Deltaproteobacteria bacterium]|nr:AbrB family transcriptional regulator [Deltaproteobacteria bacterium]